MSDLRVERGGKRRSVIIEHLRGMPLDDRMRATRQHDLIKLSEARDKLTEMEYDLRCLVAQSNMETPGTVENALERAHLQVERAMEAVADRLHAQGDKPMIRS